MATSIFTPPPLKWIFLTIFLLVTTTTLHMMHSQNGADLQSSLRKEAQNIAREVQLYVSSLESEIATLQLQKSQNASIIESQQSEIVPKPHIMNVLNHNADLQLFVEPGMVAWHSRVVSKLKCLHEKKGGLYLFHVRKAAGTTIREIMEFSSKKWHVPFFETEGLSLDSKFLEPNNLLTVLTLRDPVKRVQSLYWYEHVGWYDGILKQPEKCKSFQEWVTAWRDGSSWKQSFTAKNPRNVYIEIENYYVKMLTGWTGLRPVGRDDLLRAMEILEKFDVVLITEWMADDTQVNAMNVLFPGRNNIAASHKVRGDKDSKDRLKTTLAADEAAVLETVKAINGLDLQLWDHAQSLLAKRFKVVNDPMFDTEISSGASAQCGPSPFTLPQQLRSQLGIFRPPGHKGPL